MHIKRFTLSPFQSNCYVLSETATDGAPAVIIDPGDLAVEPVLSYIRQHDYQVQSVWATHAHVDHVMGVDVIREALLVPAYVHRADKPLWSRLKGDAMRWLGAEVQPLEEPDGYFEEGQKIFCGDLGFTIWHTPGHSPGSVCLIGKDIAFTGDTLFAQGIGRTDLQGGSFTEMSRSLSRLLELPDDLEIYPGHMGTSRMGVERQVNPFLLDL